MRHNNDSRHIIYELTERQKELNCIHDVENILTNFDLSYDEIFKSLLQILPLGWQFPEQCFCEIEYLNNIYKNSNNGVKKYSQSSPLHKNNVHYGEICIYYKDVPEQHKDKPFLLEEYSLLNTIASMLASYLAVRSIKSTEKPEKAETPNRSEWKIVVNMLKNTDVRLYIKIARKVLNLMFQTGVSDHVDIFSILGKNPELTNPEVFQDINTPSKKNEFQASIAQSTKLFELAEKNLSGEDLMLNVNRWIQEDKLSFLIAALKNKHTPLYGIQDAITRYVNLEMDESKLSPYSHMNVKVLLIQRLFTSHLKFVNIAKNYIELTDFHDVLQHTIYPTNSHGKLGGKSTGLYFANNIIKRETDPEFHKGVKTPETWYIASDAMLSFLHFNNLEEMVEQKYKDIEQVRAEYSNIIQIFKNSSFPHEISKGLSHILDSLGNKPVIVRSSSLLEDSFGAAFSGKYKSLFLANQGTKEERLAALKDAIAEVYASIVGPDPIEYRKEHGFIDFQEEMAILIQEVVGVKTGKYFLPAFAGVAFSNNEFRWSSRIERNDGLVRLVPGLGTRAVDRLSSDYCILASPGKPGIRVNASTDEFLRYCPRYIDLINLETNTFETLPISDVIRECKDDFPMFQKLFSVYSDGNLHEKSGFTIDFDKEQLIVTGNNLINNTNFLKRMNTILQVLNTKMGTPVDIEFAVVNDDIYLLQCRPQTFSVNDEPLPIPKDIPKKDVIFSANKYISNGRVPEITHIVYVDPEKYSDLRRIDDLKNVGRCIGKLNLLLPKKKFILLGPGRWGSKGDIKLGVNVTYSDINKTAVLIEIAKEKGRYLPDLSFGTHFFQDLVEAQIRYIPLYPDKKEIIFNDAFFNCAENILVKMLPEYKDISDVVKVIDVQAETGGNILNIVMNSELEEALAFIKKPETHTDHTSYLYNSSDIIDDNHWYWRMEIAEYIASQLESDFFGVKNLYIFGSVKNASSGPSSDIDLIVHFDGTDEQKEKLSIWFNAWSMCLDHINYLKTGYRCGGLLDVHFVTDEDIKNKSSFAVKINAVTDAAKKLEIR